MSPRTATRPRESRRRPPTTEKHNWRARAVHRDGHEPPGWTSTLVAAPFATALARANVNAQVAQALSEHSDASVHQRYVAAATIRTLPDAAAPDLSAVDIDKAASVPFRRQGCPQQRRTKNETRRIFSGFPGRGEKIRTSDPLTPSQVR